MAKGQWLRAKSFFSMPDFKLVSDYTPRGDQEKAIASLNRGVLDGDKHQVLLGVTG